MQAYPKTKNLLAREKACAAVTSCTARVRSFIAIIFSMVVLPLAASAAGPAVQLMWSVQPGSANVNAPIGQQPTLITADAQGNPSTLNLPASVPITVDANQTGVLHGGPRLLDIGTSAANGVIHFTDIQFDSPGAFTLVASAGNGTNAVLSPTNIATCQLWLDASDVNTLILNTNNQVRTWLDKSGTSNDATNVNANGVSNTPYTNSNPNFSALAYGGQRTLSFYGTNRLNIDLTRITNSTFSIVSVTMLDPTVTANNDFFIGTPFNNVDNTLHVGYRNATQYTFALYADDLNVTTPGAIPVITSHIHSPGSKAIYSNGALAGTGGSANLGVVLQGNIGRGNGGNYHGDIAEVIVYKTNLTQVQRVGVENYLANKWLNQFSAGQPSTTIVVHTTNDPTGLFFSQPPVDTTAGVTISPAVAVTVTNSTGGKVSGVTVFLSLTNGSGAVGGTLSQLTDANGVATFNDLSLTVAGQKQLSAVTALLTNISNPFNIIAAAPAQLARVTQASGSAVAGVPFATQPVIAVEDQFGNVVSNVTDTVTVSQTANGNLSATPGNSVAMATVSGKAIFSGLYITNSGTSTLTYVDSAFSLSTNSGNIAVVANVPASLAIQQEPSATAEVGVGFDTQPIVSAADVYGNSVTNGTLISVGASAGAVSGQTNVTTTAGVATYSGLSLTNLGNITLTFTSGSVSASSTPISVTPGPAVTVIWTTQPGGATAGAPFTQQPVLKTADAGGNVTTLGLGASNLVVVHLISGSGLVGDTLTYNIGTDGSNGVITFQNLQINNGSSSNVLAADFIGSMADPTNNIPNCVLWLDAYDKSTITLDGSTNVVQWTDKSGTANNATNNANYPSTNLNAAIPVNAYGGQHAVSFFGNNWLDISLDSLTGSLGGYTIFVVDVMANVTGNNYFLGSDFNNTDATLHFGYRSANQFTAAQYADDLNWTAPANFAPATPRMWMARVDSSAARQIWLNGVERANNGVSLVGTLTNSTVGRGNGGMYIGDLSEVIVYNRGLDDNERAEVEQYLTHKWFSNSRGLTAPFTVGSITPTLTVTPNGTNVTLKVTGASGTQYRVLAAPDLTLPLASWTPIRTNTIDGTGVWQFNDVIVGSPRFYRAVTP